MGTKTHLSHQLYWGRKAGEKETMSQLIKLRTDQFTFTLLGGKTRACRLGRWHW